MKKFFLVFMMMVMAVPAFAQAKYSIKHMTDDVQSALNSRRDRFDRVVMESVYAGLELSTVW